MTFLYGYLEIDADVRSIKNGVATVKLNVKNTGDADIEDWSIALGSGYQIIKSKHGDISEDGELSVFAASGKKRAIDSGKTKNVKLEIDVGSGDFTEADLYAALTAIGSGGQTAPPEPPAQDPPAQDPPAQDPPDSGDSGDAGDSGPSGDAAALPPGVDVQVSVTGEWGSTFNLEIRILNTGTTAIDGWTLNFDLPASVDTVWRGDLSADGTGGHLVGDLGWNSRIEPGASTHFGLTATLDDPGADPNQIDVAFAPLEMSGSSLVPYGTVPDAPPAPDPGSDPGDGTGNVISVSASVTTPQLQDIVDNAPPGAIIELEAGTFRFTDTLMITRDDITIKGAGIGKTILKGIHSGDADGRLIFVQGGDRQDIGKVKSDFDVGDRSFVLDRNHSVKVGDKLYIKQESDSAFLDSIGSVDWRESHSIRNTVAEVAAVNGREITLRDAIGYDYDPNKAEVSLLDMVDRVTLSDFTVTYDLGNPNHHKSVNTLASRYYRSEAITLRSTNEAELSNIESINSASTAFHFRYALDLKADNLIANGAHNKGGGGNGYAFELEDVFSSEFTNLTDMYMRHGFTMGSWYSSGNNYAHVAFTNRDVNFHGGRDFNNVVIVDESVMDNKEKGQVHTPAIIKGPEGHWGAPTDPTTNSIKFTKVLAQHDAKTHDLVYGTDNGAHLETFLGDDSLHGGAGNDTVIGGEGDDEMWGNGGADRFVFAKKKGNSSTDVIHDFAPDDQIELGNGLSIKSLEVGNFGYGNGAKDTKIKLSDGGEIFLVDASIQSDSELF